MRFARIRHGKDDMVEILDKGFVDLGNLEALVLNE